MFISPELDAVLWRYLDFTKFVSLLDREALFFARADKLGDPFEGSLSKVNVALHPVLYKDHPPDSRSQLTPFLRALPRFMLINCWHERAHESAAMWRLYSRWTDGLAIRTTFKSLRECFTGSPDVMIGRVSYIDYDTTFINESNAMAPYLHKRTSFEYEHEVRAVTMNVPSQDGAVDLSTDICDTGLYYDVDIALLVEEVVVAPHAEDWFVELVQSVAARYNLKVPVRRSSLADAPTWG